MNDATITGMTLDRLQYFGQLAAEQPDVPQARYAHANELFKAGHWAKCADEFTAYLALAPDDEGSAHGRLAAALAHDGRLDDAADSYLAGIDAAERNGHHGMADDFRAALEAL